MSRFIKGPKHRARAEALADFYMNHGPICITFKDFFDWILQTYDLRKIKNKGLRFFKCTECTCRCRRWSLRRPTTCGPMSPLFAAYKEITFIETLADDLDVNLDDWIPEYDVGQAVCFLTHFYDLQLRPEG